jgi:hypothetical protein
MVHRTEVARAIVMIARRRAKVDDRHRDMLPDSEDSDPREVLDYLRKFSGRDIPLWVLQAEVSDALTLNNWLWWEDRRRELFFLKAGRARGLFLSQLGALVGVKKQGLRDRVDRLEALLRFDRPDEKLTRAARQAARAADHRRLVETRWIDKHRAELLRVIEGLVHQADRYEILDEDREWIDELARDARDDALVPTTLVLLGLAAAELRTWKAVVALDGSRPHRVHAVLTDADNLRSAFAAPWGRGEPTTGC